MDTIDSELVFEEQRVHERGERDAGEVGRVGEADAGADSGRAFGGWVRDGVRDVAGTCELTYRLDVEIDEDGVLPGAWLAGEDDEVLGVVGRGPVLPEEQDVLLRDAAVHDGLLDGCKAAPLSI